MSNLNQTAPMPNALRRFFDGGPPLQMTRAMRATLTTGAGFDATRRNNNNNNNNSIALSRNAREINGRGTRAYLSNDRGGVFEGEMAADAPSKTMPKIIEKVHKIKNGTFKIEDDLAGNAAIQEVTGVSCPPGYVLNLEPEKFEFFQVREPKIKAVPNVCEGGYMNQPALTSSKTRQKALETLSSQIKAETAIKEKNHEQMRLAHLMMKRHPRGVLGVENPANENSLIYRDEHQKFLHDTAKIANQPTSLGFSETANFQPSARRQIQMKSQSSSVFSFAEGGGAGSESVPLFSRRRKNAKWEDNKARLFTGEDDYDPRREPWVLRPPRMERMVEIRNNDTNGRRANIITGALIEHIPPTMTERVNHKMLHYSLNPPPTPPHVRS